ncbi:MAG TPA: hypothetical protein DDX91_08030 [Ruminococcaceae bacterium]|nr:hypothetical protein [Oscillospiraceae bacterium]
MLTKKSLLIKASLLFTVSILFTACDNEQPIDIVIGEHTEATGSISSEIPNEVTAAITSSPTVKTDEPVSDSAPIIRTDEPVSDPAPIIRTEAPEMNEAEKLKAALEILPFDSFPAPDGSTIRKEEAISSIDNSDDGTAYILVYDGAYIRYASPIYIDTDFNPSLYHFSSDTWNSGILSETREIIGECFKVKKGDVLENGLKVMEARSLKKANLYYAQHEFNAFYSSEIIFEGSLTLEGVLYRSPEYEFGVADENEVLFFPNPTKNGFIPCMVTDTAEANINKTLINNLAKFTDKNNEFAFISGVKIQSAFNLGDLSEIASFSGKLSKGECLKATITITDIEIRFSEYLPSYRPSAKAVEIKEILR